MHSTSHTPAPPTAPDTTQQVSAHAHPPAHDQLHIRRQPSAHGQRQSRLLHRVGDAAANAVAGVVAAAAGLLWLVIGKLTGFQSWWQIGLYSATALTTFVMVFVIQHTQSRQVAALQRKLDELIRSSRQADNTLIAVEHAPDAELQHLADASKDLRSEALGG